METGIASVSITASTQVTNGVITYAALASDAKIWAMLWGK